MSRSGSSRSRCHEWRHLRHNKGFGTIVRRSQYLRSYDHAGGSYCEDIRAPRNAGMGTEGERAITHQREWKERFGPCIITNAAEGRERADSSSVSIDQQIDDNLPSASFILLAGAWHKNDPVHCHPTTFLGRLLSGQVRCSAMSGGHEAGYYGRGLR